jgi:uncharacterized damage-inducible protein DinB
MPNPYEYLTQTFETEILKTVGIWQAFPEDKLTWRPAAKSRTVAEQMEHQCKSEHAWMKKMFGIDTGNELPAEQTRAAYIAKYRGDANKRLAELRKKPPDFWAEPVAFFDVQRPRAWVMLRRIAHSAHHRGQLITYLRVLGQRVPSVYGPTADTGDKVIYRFD